MRRTLILLAVAAVAAPAPAGAQEHGAGEGRTATVSMGFSTFEPARLQVLVGDDVHFVNDSARAHTVTADDGSYDSGQLGGGDHVERHFDAPATFAYHCRLHAGMTGRVDATRLLLTAPAAPAAPNKPFPLVGRAALDPGTAVTISDGAGRVVANASVRADGTFAATIAPRESTSLTARAGDVASAPVQLLVLDRRITAAVRGSRIAVSVRPGSPGQTVVLQMRLPLRFGWWPLERARLDENSNAVFRTPRRRLPARVVLTLPDRATVLAASSPFRRPAS